MPTGFSIASSSHNYMEVLQKGQLIRSHEISSNREGLARTRIIDACYRSAEMGREIVL